ncbi:CCA tRNA nucleotidyltransferase [Bacillus sp. Marseille-P3800]|uniref:CCA tRNA nucleotidyltransferase n=1 Tax=Bacillus sp. Marseille-P3800 TaxID=2014782 RepID=UPI000C088B1E|nr:CCA tRNA nucleotidyltransferase [Bacillus sp. Marseille-P3800]
MIPKEVKACLRELNEAGHEAYLVGGAVRDLLLKRDVHDYDIATSASPQQIEAFFKKTFRINERFQTVSVHLHTIQVEISTFKGASLVEDLQERDFTVNSLAMTASGDVMDYTNGQKDLQERILRSYYPERVFKADPLRVLRAARFISNLGFSIDEQTMRACSDALSLFSTIARERIAHEWVGVLKGAYKGDACLFLQQIQVERALPSLLLNETIYEQLHRLSSIVWETDEWAWAEYSVLVGNEHVISSFPVSNQLKKQVKQRYVFFQERQTSNWTPWMLYRAGVSVAYDVERMRHGRDWSFLSHSQLEEAYHQLPIHSKDELAITGADLLEKTSAKPGPWIKEKLERLEKAVVEGVLENKRACLLKQV